MSPAPGSDGSRWPVGPTWDDALDLLVAHYDKDDGRGAGQVKHGSGNHLDGMAGAHAAAVHSSRAVKTGGGISAVFPGGGMVMPRGLDIVCVGRVRVVFVDVLPEDRCQGEPITLGSRVGRGNHEDSRGDRKQDSDDEAHQPQG